MRDGWTETTLGDIASWSSGKNLGSDKRNELGLNPILGANGIIGRTNEVLLDEELITVGRVGACGETHRSSGPVWISDNALIVIPAEQVTIDLLFYVLSTFDYQSIISGTTQPLITQSKMKSQIVNLPPLAAQKRIVDVVSSVDVYIDALQRQADTARIARNAVLHGLLEDVADSPIRKLKDLTSKIGSGATPRGGESVYQKSGVTLIRSQNVHNALFLHEGLVAIDDSAAAALDGVSVEVNDVLINITGASVARTCLVDETVLPARVNQHVAILRTDSKVLLPGFLLQILLGQKMNSYLLDISGSGTTRQAITKAQLESLEISVPPITEQKRIVGIVSSMDDVIQSTEQAVADAKNLRSGLLSDLLSGEHEIPVSYDSLLGAA